ncbi:MAG: hydroxyacid dehydrogenase [Lentisphaeria bacterium]|nr:hydroxyacid dehydrogenase [Lentisphaeria bacterium]
MSKLKAAFLNNGGEASINYVYTEEQKNKIAEMTDFTNGVFSIDDLRNGKLQDIEVIFSTWGIPPLTAQDVQKMPKLQAIFYAAGATDSFARGCFANNVKVFSAWLANAIPVAEFCVAQILLSFKGFFRYARTLNNREMWSNQMVGPGCYGETIALIGAGAISTKIQELLKPYNINIIVVPSRKENRTVSLEEAFSKALIVSNHLPDRDDNIGVLDYELFASMRHGATFINTGRGRQVNEADLIQVMRERTDLTALLDVTCPEPPEADSELYTIPNIFLTPHMAGSMNDEVHRMADYMIEEFQRFVNKEELKYQVSEKMLLTSKN